MGNLPRLGMFGRLGASVFSPASDALPMDDDAQAFLTAASITDETISNAINVLVNDLKTAQIYANLRAIYPFVGGTADTHKFNLKDPRDLDAAYRLTFGGGWTHNANGITGNGSNTFADTFAVPATVFAGQSGALLGLYSRTAAQAPANWYDMASTNASNLNNTILICRYSNDTAYFCFGSDQSFQYNKSSIGDGSGLFVSRRLSGVTSGWRNGVKLGEASPSVNYTSTPSITIGCSHYSAGANYRYFTTRNYAFACIGFALSDSEMAALYSAVQAFQAALGREV